MRRHSILMFDNLSDKLQRVFKNLRGEGKLTAENMETALREIRMALLEADVNFRVVKQLIENIKVKAMGEEVLSALSPSQQVVKIVHEELIKILGSHESKLRFANDPPSVFLIVGLQGSGKTTSTGKLVRWLSKNGHRPMVVSVDVYRGAALSIRHVTGQPLKFVGVGERSDALEAFHPDRAANRILGMGDILSFIEKAEEAIDKKQAVEMQRKLIENDFTLEDFRDQLRQIRKLGPLQSLLGMMPKVGMLKDLQNVKVDENEINHVVAIIDSMTPHERDNHMIINGSRRRRIAKGSGTTVQEVNQLLQQ